MIRRRATEARSRLTPKNRNTPDFATKNPKSPTAASGPGKATYHIAWNHQKAPYGFMVEFGTSRAPAHPFLRPAYTAVATAALRAVRDRMLSEVKKAL